MVYPDAEGLLIVWLTGQFAGKRVLTETPENLTDVLPCIQVTAIGGSGDQYQFDTARVDIDVYHSTRGAARSLANEVRASLLQTLPGQMVDGTFVLRVDEFMRPTWTPHDNLNLRRFTVGVSLRLHRVGA